MPLQTNNKIPVPEVAAASDGKLLPVPYVSQQRYHELCWAACCAMTIGMYQRIALPLCQMVSAAFGRNCCPDDELVAYNTPYWPDNVYYNYNYHYLYWENALSLGNIVYEIDAGRPINVVLQWGLHGEDDGKHMLIIAGYYQTGELQVLNPLSPAEADHPAEGTTGRVGYDYLKSGFGRGYWFASYYNLAPDNAARA